MIHKKTVAIFTVLFLMGTAAFAQVMPADVGASLGSSGGLSSVVQESANQLVNINIGGMQIALVGGTCGSWSCTGSQEPCCNGTCMACCGNSGYKDGIKLAYDISKCSQANQIQDYDLNLVELCADGEVMVNGNCMKPCDAFTNDVGAAVPKTNPGATVVRGCYTYTCNGQYSKTAILNNSELYASALSSASELLSESAALNYISTGVSSLPSGWTSSSSCACSPGVTYYEPCGDCGTRSRSCTTSGNYMAWSTCAE